jgi:phosphonatase-like hydrolase
VRFLGKIGMVVKLVVFDLAGTTVHDSGGVNGCLRAVLQEAGLLVSSAAVNEVMGLPKREALSKLIEPSAQRDELLPRLEQLHQQFVARMICFYAGDPSVHEIPGSSNTFAALRKAGVKVALNTGFSRDIVQVILQRLGWFEGTVIDASVASDEVARGRPHPDMIRSLMARLGIQDSRMVAKVGDTPADLQEGVNAGCGLVIGVTEGTHSRAQLERYPHTLLIATVADLPAVLG